jgi:hypothetical protein
MSPSRLRTRCIVNQSFLIEVRRLKRSNVSASSSPAKKMSQDSRTVARRSYRSRQSMTDGGVSGNGRRITFGGNVFGSGAEELLV